MRNFCTTNPSISRHFFLAMSLLLIGGSFTIACVQTPPEADLETPDPDPANPTIPPAHNTIGFNGVLTKLPTKPNGDPVPANWVDPRIELIDPNGFRMIYPPPPAAATAEHSPFNVVPVNGIYTFSGHCWKLGGAPWDVGVYTMELQMRYKTSRNGAWSPWQVVDTGKFTVQQPGGGGGGLPGNQ